jgi:hypothetical protein
MMIDNNVPNHNPVLEENRDVESLSDVESASNATGNPNAIIAIIISFLEHYMCKTLASRIVSIILLAVKVQVSTIASLTGLCDRTIRNYKKKMDAGNTKELLSVGGGGRKSKLADYTQEIKDEIENGNYYTLRQIALQRTWG